MGPTTFFKLIEPTSHKRHNSLICDNTVRRVKHLDNGLTFMPVQGTGVFFLFFSDMPSHFYTQL